MSGLPIRNWAQLLESIERLRPDQINVDVNKTTYSHTWDNYLVTVSNSPQKIVEILEPGDYQILIRNPHKKSVFLYLGEDGAEYLNLQNSAFELSAQGKKITTKQCLLWAIAPVDTEIVITIHSVHPNLNKTSEEMPAPLLVETDAPTGQNFYIPEDFNQWKGEQFLQEKGDSVLGIENGFKLFYFSSYDLNVSLQNGYEFSLNIDPQFTSIGYNQGEFVQVHEIKKSTLDKINLWFCAGWTDDELGKYLP